MKATEIQCGDIILVDGKPTRVYGVMERMNRIYDTMTNDISLKRCSGMPLTPEILKKNGFEAETFLSSEWGCEVYFREFPGCVVEPDDAGYIFGTISYWGKQANDGSPEDWGTMYESRIKGLHYVHELQHALRLCGLDELADNFLI